MNENAYVEATRKKNQNQTPNVRLDRAAREYRRAMKRGRERESENSGKINPRYLDLRPL